MRGEHAWAGNLTMSNAGSSPHARGTLCRSLEEVRDTRFIPACAGNTRRMAMSTVVCSVHPRMRGEHDRANVNLFCRHGSSPHARGTLGVGQAVCVVCAVHPRMRGEHFNGESLL